MNDTATMETAKPGAGLSEIWTALGGRASRLSRVVIGGEGALPSAFAVTDLAAGAVAAAGLALSDLSQMAFRESPDVLVDRRLASLWFGTTLAPSGWSLPPAWDAIAGDYRTADGWIRLHTNAPHHRAAAMRVLGVPENRGAVAAAVARLEAEGLETDIVAEGGCAAAMRSLEEWRHHPQGRAVALEPLLWRADGERASGETGLVDPTRPLKGIRVLDLTRVLAGPVATRFLALAGADVLRIDPPDWNEPGVLAEVTPGKRRARLDLKSEDGRRHLIDLMRQADIMVHGYRSDALEALGLGAEERQILRPGLVDVSLDAYGWTGPWKHRRGFDSLVQMSSGIAAEGMRHYRTPGPKPLPVQALDHAAGFIMAAAAIRGLTTRLETGRGSIWRTSLARVACLLAGLPAEEGHPTIGEFRAMDFAGELEATGWGPAQRLRQPLAITGLDLRWERQAGELGVDAAEW